MADAPPPIEWVPGRSTLPWMLGQTAVLLALITAGEFLVGAVIGPVGPPHFIGFVESLAILAPLVMIGVLVWWLAVPRPVSMLGVSPVGVIISEGLRDIRLPWAQTLVAGNVLYVVPRRSGIVAPYRLTDYQAARLRSLHPT
jgi:hypothetical protein